MYTYVYMLDVCMHAYMYVCMHACMHACVHVCMNACMYACVHTYIHTYVYMYIYICIHARVSLGVGRVSAHRGACQTPDSTWWTAPRARKSRLLG